MVLELLDASMNPVDTIRVGSTTADLFNDIESEGDTLWLIGGSSGKSLIIKMLLDGTILWQRRFHSGSISSILTWAQSRGDTLIVGGQASYGSRTKPTISFVNKRNGQVINDARFTNCNCTGAGNVYFSTSIRRSTIPLFTFRYTNGITAPWNINFLRIDLSGNIQSAYTFTGAQGYPRSLVELNSDSLLLLTERTPAVGNQQITNLLSKHGPEGEVAWAKHYYEAGSGATILLGNFIQYGDELILAGVIEGHTGTLGGADVLIMSTDTMGNVNWARIFGGSGDEGGSFVQATQNGYLIHGATTTSGAGGYDFLYVLADFNGNIVSPSPCYQVINFTPSDSLVPMSRNSISFSVASDLNSSPASLSTSGTSGFVDDFCSVLAFNESSEEPSEPTPSLGEKLFQLLKNPFSDDICLQSHLVHDMQLQLQIFDLSGREALSRREFLEAAPPSEICLPATSLKRGMYLLRLTSDSGQIWSWKIVKE